MAFEVGVCGRNARLIRRRCSVPVMKDQGTTDQLLLRDTLSYLIGRFPDFPRTRGAGQ